MKKCKGRELLHLPVISLADGKTHGQVLDLVWDAQGRLLYLLTGDQEPEGLIETKQVYGFGRDALTVADQSLIQKLSPELVETECRWSSLTGTLVMTAAGRNLGRIGDVVLEMTNGQVQGYEISDGFLGDILHGRREIPLAVVEVTAEEVIVVDGLGLEGKV